MVAQAGMRTLATLRVKESLRRRAEQPAPPRVDPPVTSLEQERITTLLQQLGDEIGPIHECSTQSETSGRGPNEVDVIQRAREIICEVPRLCPQQNELLVP